MQFLLSILGAILFLVGIYLGIIVAKPGPAVMRGEQAPNILLGIPAILSVVLEFIGLRLLEVPLFINLPIVITVLISFGFWIGWRDPGLNKVDRVIGVIVYLVIWLATVLFIGYIAYTGNWASYFPLYRIK